MNYQQTRRSFIKTTSLAVGGIGALGPVHILRSAEVPASERITVGFIGLGRNGRGHITHRFGRRPEVHGIMVCDVDTTRREFARNELNKINAEKGGWAASKDVVACNDYREILEREDIDAVVISTPDHWHAIVTIEALRAGKDVYCEKPLTHTPNEALAVMAAVKKYDRVLQTGSQQRSRWPEFRRACELVVNGVIGEVNEVDVHFNDPPSACDLPGEEMEPGLDWDRWIGPAPMRPYHSDLSPRGVQNVHPRWRRYWEFGGGSVMDFGTHHLDIARWGMQLDDEMPVETMAPDDEDAIHGVRQLYRNGVVMTHRRGNGLQFHGSEGRIRVNRDLFELWRGDEREFASPGQSRLAIERYLTGDNVKRLYRSTDHAQDFLDAVKSRKRPICHEDIGGRSAMCCQLMNIVYRYGKSLKWDAANDTFAPGGGDPEWLGREYRPGYELPV